jgi:uncharacterized protein (TIGR02217 family)
MSSFHDILFPLDISMRSSGGPERKTDIVTFSSGREQRNIRWQLSRRRYDAGYGIKTLSELHKVIAFFEEQRGMLYAFRWRDRFDFKSCALTSTPAALDQNIAIADGQSISYQLIKNYGTQIAPYARPIKAPVRNSVVLAVDGTLLIETKDYSLDYTSGLISFTHPPRLNAQITAGYIFDVPVRFDADFLEINLAGFDAGIIPKIPIIEVIE